MQYIVDIKDEAVLASPLWVFPVEARSGNSKGRQTRMLTNKQFYLIKRSKT
jgi:hypothetical protein